MVKDLTIQVLIKKVEELTSCIERFEKENNILRHENDVLKAEVAELRARLESDSHNSNKPPSKVMVIKRNR